MFGGDHDEFFLVLAEGDVVGFHWLLTLCCVECGGVLALEDAETVDLLTLGDVVDGDLAGGLVEAHVGAGEAQLEVQDLGWEGNLL